MEVLIFNKKDIFNDARICNSLIGKSIMPILSAIKINAKDNEIILTSTNLATSIVARCITGFKNKEQSFLIESSKLVNFLQIFPDDAKVEIKHSEDFLIIIIGTSQLKLSKMDINSFPAINECNDNLFVNINNDLIHDINNSCVPFVVKELARPIFTGISFRKRNFAATNGRVLAEISTTESLESDYVISSDLFRYADGLKFDSPKMYFSEQITTIKDDRYTLSANNIIGTFPSYENLINCDVNAINELIVDTDKFLTNVKTAAVLSKEKILLEIDDNKLNISAHGDNESAMLLEMDCQFEGKLKIRLSVSFLIHVLQACNEPKIFLSTHEKPVRIVDSEKRFIIMPLRMVTE